MRIRDKVFEFIDDANPFYLALLIPICLCLGRLIWLGIEWLALLFK